MSDALSSIPEPDDTDEIRRLRRELADAEDAYDRAFEKWQQHQWGSRDTVDRAEEAVTRLRELLDRALREKGAEATKHVRTELSATQLLLPHFDPPRKA